MSKPRYWWYTNVCKVIVAYPELRDRVKEMREQKIVPAYSAAPKTAGDGRGIENIALRVLSSREYKDFEAVRMALNEAATWEDGSMVMEVVAAHAWNDRLRFEETGRKLFISASTAKRLYQRFVYTVARNLGYKKLS